MDARYAALEAGGSKWRCAVGNLESGWLAQTTIPTTDPASTLTAVTDFLAPHQPFTALGVASFGPLDVDPDSPHYGTLLDTPKLDWQGVDLRAALTPLASLCVFQTDVYGAALAELHLGAGREASPATSSLAYITVGTGIGAACAQRDGQQSRSHGEFGHVFVPRHIDDDFAGVCPYHGDCLEGLASANALRARWGSAPEHLHAPHVWDIQAHYLAQACLVALRTWAPQRLVLAGGVLQREGLLVQVRAKLEVLLAGYHAPDGAEVLVAPGLALDSGLWGALCLAMDAAGEARLPE